MGLDQLHNTNEWGTLRTNISREYTEFDKLQEHMSGHWSRAKVGVNSGRELILTAIEE
jgi:hypothetical protein